MMDFFLKGGPLMYVLALFSIVALTIIIDRLIFLHRVQSDTNRFLETLRHGLLDKDIARVIEICDRDISPPARVLRAGLRKYRKGREEMEKAIEHIGGVEVNVMERGMLTLSSIGRLSPLVGFLGTVTGMIRAFNAIGASGAAANPGLVAKGVSEAMITTATGLTVAIPALIFTYFLNGKIGRLVAQMEKNSIHLLDLIDEMEEEQILRLVSSGGREGEE